MENIEPLLGEGPKICHEITIIDDSISRIDTVIIAENPFPEGTELVSPESPPGCRYCYDSVESNFSSCHCTSPLCRSCFINELKLSADRNDPFQCTVCKKKYNVSYQRTSGDYCNLVLYAIKQIPIIRLSSGNPIPFSVLKAVIMIILGLTTFPWVCFFFLFEPGLFGFLAFVDIFMCIISFRFITSADPVRQPVTFLWMTLNHITRACTLYSVREHSEGVDYIMLGVDSSVCAVLYFIELMKMLYARCCVSYEGGWSTIMIADHLFSPEDFQ